MALLQSSQFASAAATGADWREAAKAVLETLKRAGPHEKPHNFGFLYISDHLGGDATGIIGLFQSVLGIETWIGAVGLGVCGSGESFIDRPAIAAMTGYFDLQDFCLIRSPDDPDARQWLEANDPMLVFVHGDPLGEDDPARTIRQLEQTTGGFVTGGLSSSRHSHFQFANGITNSPVSGAAFSQKVAVASALSQGCVPVGPVHSITRCDENIIRELDGRPAGAVFEDDIRTMAIRKIERDPDTIILQTSELGPGGALPEQYKSLFKGEIHAALPIPESDLSDYLVRNIIGIDPDEGSMMIAQAVSTGERLMFVRRDDATVQEDLSRSLLELRKRITAQNNGIFAPRGGIYVSCVARAFSRLGENDGEDEMKLIHDIIGDVPLAGFYAGGEISNARLYGYTGILTLFL